ncbi:MarR family protein [Maioricimonas rarisocia]|uniref:MarR family protein n=1 Tax=Maioricimonas rarisocia TaxID=2528026 RepID=A0A517ZG42_9PLAN|nr:helix-turn-helix transcriptional regulator [Maioricimonas rarisocia]QDU41412.1 MarR family protein [Maioricimonas rarisocia]
MTNVPLSTSDRDLLRQLRRLGAATVRELCESCDVTATAIRQRLGRLESAALVEKEIVRHGRGRPRNCYKLTDNGLQQLGENYAELAQLLWEQLANIDDPGIRGKLIDSLRSAMVERYGSSVDGATLKDRIRQLGAALAQRGADVEIDDREAGEGGLPILRENNCPYHRLAAADGTICELEQSVFESVLDAEVELTACCMDGHHCCEFEVTERSGHEEVSAVSPGSEPR